MIGEGERLETELLETTGAPGGICLGAAGRTGGGGRAGSNDDTEADPGAKTLAEIWLGAD